MNPRYWPENIPRCRIVLHAFAKEVFRYEQHNSQLITCHVISIRPNWYAPSCYWEAFRWLCQWPERRPPLSQNERTRTPWSPLRGPGQPCNSGCSRRPRRCRTWPCCRWSCQGSWWKRCQRRNAWRRTGVVTNSMQFCWFFTIRDQRWVFLLTINKGLH